MRHIPLSAHPPGHRRVQRARPCKLRKLLARVHGPPRQVHVQDAPGPPSERGTAKLVPKRLPSCLCNDEGSTETGFYGPPARELETTGENPIGNIVRTAGLIAIQRAASRTWRQSLDRECFSRKRALLESGERRGSSAVASRIGRSCKYLWPPLKMGATGLVVFGGVLLFHPGG